MRDLRDCSGPWSGFWIQDLDRGTMKLRLWIKGELISGEGEDVLGGFVVYGNYWPAKEIVKLRKRYATHAVEYNGTWDGSMISGLWRIRAGKRWDGEKGGFDLWPDTEEEAVGKFTETVEDRVPVAGTRSV